MPAVAPAFPQAGTSLARSARSKEELGGRKSRLREEEARRTFSSAGRTSSDAPPPVSTGAAHRWRFSPPGPSCPPSRATNYRGDDTLGVLAPWVAHNQRQDVAANARSML